MSVRDYGNWISGEWRRSELFREIFSPSTGKQIARRSEIDDLLLEKAIASAERAFIRYRRISRATRSKLLLAMVRGLETRRAEIVQTMVEEAGKPWLLSDAEVGRAMTTFTVAAEEAKRLVGDVLAVDIESSGRAYDDAISYWVPRGPVLAISPFNFPLNLAAHKIAPALACGASVILKPPPQAPGATVILAEIFAEAAKQVSDSREIVPLDAFQLVHASNEVMALAIADSRLKTLSFTGSQAVGWKLQALAVRKKVVLELGGNAAVIVDETADLKRAAARCAYGAFAYAGQVCISVQRIFVHEKVRAPFESFFLEEVGRVRCGDPTDHQVICGPIIDSKAADRLMSWIDEAKHSGARVLAGGTRKENLIAPTVLSDVPRDQPIVANEAFGPVVVLESFRDIGEAIRAVNDSQFGLQAGVFTSSILSVQQAKDELEVGGILVNEVPTYRQDSLPYGGVKESGLGREGLRYAMEDFSERRTVVSWRG